MGRGDDFTIVALKSGYIGDDIIFAAVPLFTRVSCEIEFFEIGQFGHASDTVFKIEDINKVDSHVEFSEAFASLNVFDFGNVIESKVDVLEFLEFVEIFHFFDDVILQVQNFKVTA